MAKVDVKKIRERVVKMDSAWEEGAPAVNFGGIAQAAFKAEITSAETAELELTDLLALADMKRTEIDDKFAALQEKSVLVVNGVKATPHTAKTAPSTAPWASSAKANAPQG